MTNTPTRRLVPVEATEEMVKAAQSAHHNYIRSDDASFIIAASLAASPASGKVSEAEVERAYEAAKAACQRCTQNFCGDCDCDGFTCKEGIRAALASLGLEVG